MLLDGLPYAPPWTITRAGPFRISRHHYLPEHQLLDAHDTTRRAHRHPRGVAYRAPAGARALAHAAERPGSIITGFGALALHGLPYLTEGHDTVLVAPTSKTLVGDLYAPTVVRRGSRPGETITAYVGQWPFHVATPAAAMIHALKSWGSSDLEAIQLIDCVRRYLDVGPDEILAAGHGRIDRRRLGKLVKHSSERADSPKETEMRLMATRLAARYGVTLVEQHPIYLAGRLLTVFDLVLLEPKIGLMYDGAHHWDYQQRQKDALINLEATTQGWIPLRFSSQTLPELPDRLGRLLDAIFGRR